MKQSAEDVESKLSNCFNLWNPDGDEFMRGIVMCMNCKHHQGWIARSGWRLGKIACSNCRKCGKRNRFYPHRWGDHGQLTETRGRKPAVWFRRRPEWTIPRQMNEESKHRNRGSIVDLEEQMAKETLSFRERVQNRIDEVKE